MTIFWVVLSGLLSVLGLVGCVVPVLPGPLLSYCGLLCLLPTAHAPSVAALVVFGAMTVVVTVLDYVVPVLGAGWFNCSKWGVWGCAVGVLVGVFWLPLGLLLGPFLGAVVGELLARKPIVKAMYGGLGALLGFLSGVLVKLAVCIAALTYCVVVFLKGIR